MAMSQLAIVLFSCLYVGMRKTGLFQCTSVTLSVIGHLGVWCHLAPFELQNMLTAIKQLRVLLCLVRLDDCNTTN